VEPAVQKLFCPRRGVSHLAFSPDGDLLAGIGQTGLYCWLRSRNWEPSGLEHDGPITGLAFHPTGRTLAYAAYSHHGAAAAPPPPPPGAPVPSVWRRRFAHEYRRTFTGIHLYSLTGTDEFVPNRVRVPHIEGTVTLPGSWARGLAFAPDGRVLLAGHVEHSGFNSAPPVNVYHWHFTEEDGVWRVTEPVAAHAATERGGVRVDDSCVALAGRWGVAVCPCPIAPATDLFMLDVRAAGAVALAPARELVAAWMNGGLFVWHLRAGDPVTSANPLEHGCTALAYSPDGQTLAIGDARGVVRCWEPLTGASAPNRDYNVGEVTALAYAPDGLTLAVAGRTGLVVVDTD
jgi:WD40 repeat protein